MISSAVPIRELEKTMFNHFCMSQKLRLLFHQQQIPQSIHPIISHYYKAFSSDIRGTLLNDNLAFDEDSANIPVKKNLSILPKEYHSLLRQWLLSHDPDVSVTNIPLRASMRAKFQRFGQVFQAVMSSPRDSYIMYKDSTSGTRAAGCIRDIFTHARYRHGSATVDTFFIVDTYMPLSSVHAEIDPYRQFPIVGGRLFYNSFLPHPTIILASDVMCHFACTVHDVPGIDEKCIHALPFDKAGPITSSMSSSSESQTGMTYSQRGFLITLLGKVYWEAYNEAKNHNT
jgi:hypothetical protein